MLIILRQIGKRRAYVLEQGVNWAECLSLIEFTYNNFHSNIGMTPLKLCMEGGVGRRSVGMS